MPWRPEFPQDRGEPGKLPVLPLVVAFIGTPVLTQFAVQGSAVLLFADRQAATQELVRILYPPFYAMVLMIALPRMGAIVETAARHWLPSVCVLWCLASTLWSVEPEVSGRRAVLLLGTMLFSLYLTVSLPLATILRVFQTVVMTTLIASLLATLVRPDTTIGSDAGGMYYQGLFEHRNGLGGTMMLGIFAVLGSALLERPRWSGRRVLALLLMLGALAVSRSMTSVVVAAVMLVLYAAIADRSLTLRFGLVVGGVLFASALVLMPDLFFALLGKDMSLTGRTVIWAWVADRIGEAPLTGYGYAALFNHLGLETQEVQLLPRMSMSHPHNGYLATALSGGLPLLLLAVVMLLRLLQNSAALMRLGLPYGTVGLIFGVVFAAYNMTEITFLQLNDPMWSLFLIIYAKVAATRMACAAPGQHGVPAPRAGAALGLRPLGQPGPRPPVAAG